MRPNIVKEKLRHGEAVFGYMNLIHHPAVVEILGAAGFELVVIDGEHGAVDRQLCEHMVRAAETAGCVAVLRTAVNHPREILPYLDTGVLGVMVPHVMTAEKAAMIVEAVKYPPEGTRGSTPGRANAYAVGMLAASDYVATANRETMIIVQIEDAEAVDHLDEILAVPGIDVFDIGTGDLANSLGYPGQPTHPEVIRVIDAIVAAADRARCVTSNPGTDLPAMARYFPQGARCFLLGDGRMLFRAGREQVQGIRAILR